MKWTKLGRIYDPYPVHEKLQSHAANPLPILLGGDVYRVFFSGRDRQQRSSVGFVDLDLVRREVLSVSHAPVFEHGSPGTFYSHGVSIGNWYQAGGRRYILFMGWQIPPGEHWRGQVGRLELSSDLALRLDPDHPFLPLDAADPVSLSYPWVMPAGRGYVMWYGSTLTWDGGNGEMVHVLKTAFSADGERWERNGAGVPYRVGVAQAFSRPTVVGAPGAGWHMWFSYRSGSGQTYRIGYAFSPDGESWELGLDTAGIDVSADGWDSEMIEYPYVLEHKGERYLFYNGNGYGKTGFGLAIWTDD